ncbi:TM1812 family CRISPR-associated protein [Ruminococcus sp. HUN007]|uniref:TM1812 family CRISPR-associated protein n=1 Tax=Ruminococcus sp. HUN007 TaxID=1514668 RepID=UPI0005D274AF|nr:TM1812 family CRISPR-associated protein [Ruminococcus sp. HUN007]
MANIIIMNLSKLPPALPKNSTDNKDDSKTPNEVDYDGGKFGVIKGLYTADAPLKYLIEYIKSKNESVDKILTVVTDEAKTAFVALREMLKVYDPTVPEPIEIPGEDQLKTVQEIIDKVEPNDKIYIESTGGLRNTTYTLMTIVRILEYSGVTFEKAVYSNVGEKRIEDITSTYRMFNLINSVNSFTSYGSASELESLFKNNDHEIISETIAAMKDFSDDITLCRTSRLDSTLERLNECLIRLSTTKVTSKEAILFKSLSKVIRKKFYMDKDNRKIEYTDVVRWCLDNKLVQQAVTVFTEKMPKYFFDHNLFTVDENELEVIREKNKKSSFGLEYELFYSGLMTSVPVPDYADDFQKIVKAADFEKKSVVLKKSDERIIYEALCECENITTFRTRISSKKFGHKYDIDTLRDNLDKYFKVKTLLYDSRGNIRKINFEEELKDYPEISEWFLKIKNPNTVKGFISSVVNDGKICEELLNFKTEYSDNHLNFISWIDKKSDRCMYSLNTKATVDEWKSIFMDIYYIKTFIRNNLNHASEDEVDDEKIKFFSSDSRYIINTDFSVEYIIKILNEALNKIEKIS